MIAEFRPRIIVCFPTSLVKFPQTIQVLIAISSAILPARLLRSYQRRVLAGRLARGGIPMNSPDMNTLPNAHASHITRRTFCNELLLTTGVVLVAPAQVRAGGQVWAVGKSFGRKAELITQEVRKT